MIDQFLRNLCLTLRFPLVISLVLALFTRQPLLAQPLQGDPTAAVQDALLALNVLWVILTAFLIFLMLAGFALVESGFTRAKNVSHTMMMCLMVFAITALCYWLLGFGVQYGGVNYSYPALGTLPAWNFVPSALGDWAGQLDRPLLMSGQGFLGLSGFMLTGLGANVGILAFFFFQLLFAASTAVIPTGGMAERIKFSGYVWMTMWISLLVYPLIGNWVWGGGWLANLGRWLGYGNGVIDYAGSGVIHMTGGAVALAGAQVIGARIGRFNRGMINSIAGHNIPMGALGAFILFLGWFACNAGAGLGFTPALRGMATLALINTALAASAGGVSAMLYMWLFSSLRKPDPVITVNGLLGGAVAISAPCAFVDPWAAVVIGIIAGFLMCLSALLLERLQIDDPVCAAPVHLVCGIWGVLAVGIFANGNPDTALWNGIASPVRGLLYGENSQIVAQLIEVVAILLFVWLPSLIFFKVLNAIGQLRVSVDSELTGLDMAEMGVEGYPADFEPPYEVLRQLTVKQ